MGRKNNGSNYSEYKWDTDKIIYKDECFECGNEGEIHYHHIIPEIRGGKKTIPLCNDCHGLVHDRNFDHHRELQRIGIEKAKVLGKYKGRVVGSKEDIDFFLKKPKTQLIISLLNEKVGIREIMRRTICSPNTIYKIKKWNVQKQN